MPEVTGVREMTPKAGDETSCLTDVKDLSLLIQKAIDTGRSGAPEMERLRDSAATANYPGNGIPYLTSTGNEEYSQ